MKKTTIISLLFASVLLLAGCAGIGPLTPTQQLALGNAAGGNIVATYVLDTQGAPAVKGLNDLSAALPDIPLGKVSAFQLGAINAELKGIQDKVVASINSGTTTVGTGKTAVVLSQVLDQVGSLISLVSKSMAANSGGNETLEQSVLVASAQNIANGIQNAISYWQGGQSIAAPPTS